MPPVPIPSEHIKHQVLAKMAVAINRHPSQHHFESEENTRYGSSEPGRHIGSDEGLEADARNLPSPFRSHRRESADINGDTAQVGKATERDG